MTRRRGTDGRDPVPLSPALPQRIAGRRGDILSAMFLVFISHTAGTSASALRYGSKERGVRPAETGTRLVLPGQVAASFEGGTAVTAYHVTLRDRETETVVGYYNGAWTTDRCRALTIRKREVAEAHAARMRDRCPRNSDLIKVEKFAAAD
jgi:hypothetical protein